MSAQDEPVDSSVGWVAAHIARYVATNGEEGRLWHGVPTLLLTTRGRRPGRLRRTALIYGRDGERYLVVESKGGAAAHPLWYLNLHDHPEVELQVGAKRIRARARTATPEERPRLWRQMTALWPAYDEYQTTTARHPCGDPRAHRVARRRTVRTRRTTATASAALGALDDDHGARGRGARMPAR